jgi:hypothetical protein
MRSAISPWPEGHALVPIAHESRYSALVQIAAGRGRVKFKYETNRYGDGLRKETFCTGPEHHSYERHSNEASSCKTGGSHQDYDSENYSQYEKFIFPYRSC